MFVPLNFSCVPVAPHEFQYDIWKEHAPIFYGKDPLEFIVQFLEFIMRENVTNKEEIMNMFAQSMSNKQRNGI